MEISWSSLICSAPTTKEGVRKQKASYERNIKTICPQSYKKIPLDSIPRVTTEV